MTDPQEDRRRRAGPCPHLLPGGARRPARAAPAHRRAVRDHLLAARAAAGDRRRRVRQDRHHGRPRHLAGGQQAGAPRGDPRRDVHPQGRRGAGPAHPRAAGKARPLRPAGTRGGGGAAGSQRLHLPLLRQHDREGTRAAHRRRIRHRAARHRAGLAGRRRRGGKLRRRLRAPCLVQEHADRRGCHLRRRMRRTPHAAHRGQGLGRRPGGQAGGPAVPGGQAGRALAGGAQAAGQAAHPLHHRRAGRRLRAGEGRARRPGLRRPRGAGRAHRPGDPGGLRGGARQVQGGAARRVPGHLARANGAVLLDLRRRARADRRGRSQPVDLRLPRRQRRAALPVPVRVPRHRRRWPCARHPSRT